MQRVVSARHVVGRFAQPAKPLHLRHASGQQPPALRTRDAKSGRIKTTLRKESTKPTEPATAPRTNEEKKEPLNFKNLPPGTVGAALLLGGIAYYSGELFVAANKTCDNPQIADISAQKDVAARYDETADYFDSEVGMSEWLMGVNKIRGQLASRCRGHVLEVSCGTGRNLGYYDVLDGGKVDSLTFVDLSAPMIAMCKQKWEALYSDHKKPNWFGGGGKVVKQDLTLRFAAISALGEMPLAPTDPPKKYDTIIQTMGLCSTDRPKELLENMVRHLDTSNPEARILLLEHGRSYRGWLNKILDNSAEKHAELHGCWYNRDIEAIVQEVADQHSLEISRQRRKHIGTTYLFELKPKILADGPQEMNKQASTLPAQDAAAVQSQEASSGSGWRSWVGLK